MRARLLPFEVGSASWNMSVDQAILESVEQSGQPTLRFYGWDQPTLSLGYFQSLSSRDQHPASKSVQIVRRSTGGGAILHQHELTYSIAVPMPTSATKKRLQLYRDMHETFVKVLRACGVQATPFWEDNLHSGCDDAFLCFQRRTDEDLVVSGYKVLGSAQRRTRSTVLQHGSLLLAASPFAPELPGISELSSKSLSADLSKEIANAVSEKLGFQLHQDTLSDQEIAQSKTIQAARFANNSWLNRRP